MPEDFLPRLVPAETSGGHAFLRAAVALLRPVRQELQVEEQSGQSQESVSREERAEGARGTVRGQVLADTDGLVLTGCAQEVPSCPTLPAHRDSSTKKERAQGINRHEKAKRQSFSQFCVIYSRYRNFRYRHTMILVCFIIFFSFFFFRRPWYNVTDYLEPRQRGRPITRDPFLPNKFRHLVSRQVHERAIFPAAKSIPLSSGTTVLFLIHPRERAKGRFYPCVFYPTIKSTLSRFSVD